MSDQSTDVLVVGAGNAGLCAALAAREAGASVVVLEKAPEDLRGGNTRFTGALFRMSLPDVDAVSALVPTLTAEDLAGLVVDPYDDDAYVADIMRLSEGWSDPALVRRLALESYDTAAWMRDLGVVWQLYPKSLTATASGPGRITP